MSGAVVGVGMVVAVGVRVEVGMGVIVGLSVGVGGVGPQATARPRRHRASDSECLFFVMAFSSTLMSLRSTV